MEDLIKKIEQWANDRNIIKGSKPIDQAMKLFSEFGELTDHIGNNELSKIPDDLGDIFVVLTVISAQYRNGFMNYVFDHDFGLEDLSKLTSVKHCAHALSSYLFSFVYDVQDDFCNPDFSLKSCIEYLEKIAELNNLTLEYCVEQAYLDIKDRKGILLDGVFIKESNPAYADAIKSIEDNFNAE